MKKTQKVIIMISVLLAPIFVFLFLKKFGENEFALPVYYIEGNPVAECDEKPQQHRLSNETLNDKGIKLPVLIFIPAVQKNEYDSDLENVLAKYPGVQVRALIIEESSDYRATETVLRFNSENFYKFINCELILGEEQMLTKAIANKYVLVDDERRIRGYYYCNDLDEIERLDVELDILLNF